MLNKVKNSLDAFHSLSYYVDKELKKTLYKNEEFLDNRSGFIEASIVSWSTFYKKYLFLLVLLCFLIGVNVYFYESYIQIEPNSNSLGVLLGAQITIVGLIYPLVISLVSILFQDKAGKKVIFSLYQRFSGFMFAGLSGLLLAVALTLSLFINDSLGYKASLALSASLVFWFIFNLLLTIWFFIKTLSILDENKKNKFIFQFVVNEVFKSDLKFRIRKLYLDDLANNGLLKTNRGNLLILSNEITFDEDIKEINYIAGKDRELKDVSLWKLNLAIWLQSKILHSFRKSKEKSDFKLYVDIPVSTDKNRSITVAKYSGFSSNIFVKFLIKNSVRYTKKSDKTDISILSALEAFTSPVYTALSDNDENQFIESLKKLQEYHLQIAEVLSFKQSDGKSANWLLLSEGTWGSSYFKDFMRNYYILLKQTIDKIPNSTQYFSHALYFYRSIHFRQNNITHTESNSILAGVLYLWITLLKWKKVSSKSDLTVTNGFDAAINDFVSLWEEWKNFYIKYKYINITKSYPILFEHLKYTAEMVIESLQFNNSYALGWSADMLINWKNKTLDVQTYNEEYLWYSKIIDIELLFQENPDLWTKIKKGNDDNFKSAIYIALKHAYIDVRFLTVCVMLANCDDVLRVKPYIISLIEEERVHATGTIEIQIKSINKASELLGIYIRHKKYYLDGKDIFSNWQTKLLEKYNQKFSQQMVAGRIYSGWYNVNINQELVQLMVLYSKTRWMLSKDWLDILKSNIYSFSNRQDMIRSFEEFIEIAESAYECELLSSEVTHEQAIVHRNNFIESMKRVIGEIVRVNNNHVINSSIDEELLSEMAKSASNEVLANNTKFPLNLFDVKFQDGVGLDSSSCIIDNNFDKSHIMADERPPTYNLIEAYSSGVVDCLMNAIVRRIATNKPTEYNSFDSIENLLSFILEVSKVSQKILLCHSSICDLILDIYDDENKRKEFEITKSYTESYLLKVGNCKIYNHRYSVMDSCILTANDRFESLIFESFKDKNIVNVTFSENQEDRTKGDLSFEYRVKLEEDETQPFIQLRLVREDTVVIEEDKTIGSIDTASRELKLKKGSNLSKACDFFLKYRK